MTDKKDKALKLALDVLQPDPEEAFWFVEKKKEKAITAIREALMSVPDGAEQPAQQQEPVAVMTVLHLKDRTEIGYGPASAGYDLPTGEYKLYTSPPASKPWVGLTDEEVLQLLGLHIDEDDDPDDWASEIADVRVIEAKLREKNA